MKSIKTRFFAIILATLVTPAFLMMIFSYVGTRRTMSAMSEKNVRDNLQNWLKETSTVREQRLSALVDLLRVTHHYLHQFRAFENEHSLFEHHLEDKLADFLCANSEVYAQALWVSGDGRPKTKFVFSPNYILTTGRPLKIEKKDFDSIDNDLAKVASTWTGAEIWSGPPQITGDGFAQALGIPLRENYIHWDCPASFGMLFLELRLDFLFSEAASRSAGQIFTDAIPMVFDSTGTILYHREPEFACQKVAVVYPTLAPQVFSRPTAAHFEHAGRQWMMLSARSTEQWHFTLLLEEGEFARRLQPLYWVNFPIMLIGVVVAVVLLALAFRQLAHTIHTLAAGAHAIAQGDLEKRVAIDNIEEFGALGRAFNHMAESLRGLIGERAEKQKLQELNQLKDAFISNVSHELKGPLARIDLGVENLRRGVAGAVTTKQHSYLSRIHENTRRLIRMIEELLEVSRIEAGRMTLELSSCSVKEILTEVIEEARPQWQSKKLRVSGTCTDKNVQLLADRDKLKQIISNLLDNAIKFTGEKGEISLHATQQNGRVELTIADTGIGIAPEHLDHLFERFYQVRPAMANGNGIPPGLGLGLNIVKTLVELHNGEISVESEVGAGTRVTVRLPVRGVEGSMVRQLDGSSVNRTTG